MTPFRRHFREGEPFGLVDRAGSLILDDASAAELNAVREELMRLGRVTVAPPLAYGSGASGSRFGVAVRDSVYAQLSGAGSPYSWAEAVRNADGSSSLMAGGRSGTTEAYEAEGLGGLGGRFATLDWSDAGDWRFQLIRDGSTSGGGGNGGATLPYCFCDPMPITIDMVSNNPDCNYKMYQSCTIVYGPTPPQFAPLELGPACYLSTQGFPDPLAQNAIFYYNLSCQYNQILLYRVYLESPYGSPYRDGLLYAWGLGAYGNTCDPFECTNGTPYLGSDASCFVTLSGSS